MENIDKSKIIAVEGKDEVNFFEALLKYLNIRDIQLFDYKGKGNLSRWIKAFVRTPGFTQIIKIAIIRDADHSADSALQSVKSALSAGNLVIPESENIFVEGPPSVGIFIMPGESKNGSLEDLCLSSIKYDQVYNCIHNFFDCIPEEPKNISKSKILCYLSSKNPLVNNLGLGAKNGHWNFNLDEFDNVKGFLEKMK